MKPSGKNVKPLVYNGAFYALEPIDQQFRPRVSHRPGIASGPSLTAVYVFFHSSPFTSNPRLRNGMPGLKQSFGQFPHLTGSVFLFDHVLPVRYRRHPPQMCGGKAKIETGTALIPGPSRLGPIGKGIRLHAE